MSVNDNNRNGSVGLNTPVAESSGPASPQGPIRAPEPIDGTEKAEPVIRFATRTAAKGAEGISKGKLILLGGGLAVAVLFFVFTAIVGKSPKKLVAAKPPSQQAKTGAVAAVQRECDTPHGHRADAGAGQQQRATRSRGYSADTNTGQ